MEENNKGNLITTGLMIIGILFFLGAAYLIFNESSSAKQFCHNNNMTFTKSFINNSYYCDSIKVIKTTNGWFFYNRFPVDEDKLKNTSLNITIP